MPGLAGLGAYRRDTDQVGRSRAFRRTGVHQVVDTRFNRSPLSVP
ncbi:hypothetical protein [Streptomyces sp. SCL15-4]|nr:hypothetical protein [Streptomyces sp. SCL15-4]